MPHGSGQVRQVRQFVLVGVAGPAREMPRQQVRGGFDAGDRGAFGVARAQAFLTLITQGIGIVVGSNIAGLVYGLHTDPSGAHDWRAIWIVPALIAFVTMVLFALAFREKLTAAPAVEEGAAVAART